jgi:hypothetical protein
VANVIVSTGISDSDVRLAHHTLLLPSTQRIHLRRRANEKMALSASRAHAGEAKLPPSPVKSASETGSLHLHAGHFSCSSVTRRMLLRLQGRDPSSATDILGKRFLNFMSEARQTSEIGLSCSRLPLEDVDARPGVAILSSVLLRSASRLSQLRQQRRTTDVQLGSEMAFKRGVKAYRHQMGRHCRIYIGRMS